MYLHGFILFFSSAARCFICYENADGNWIGTFLRAGNIKKLIIFEGLKHHLVFSQGAA